MCPIVVLVGVAVLLCCDAEPTPCETLRARNNGSHERRIMFNNIRKQLVVEGQSSGPSRAAAALLAVALQYPDVTSYKSSVQLDVDSGAGICDIATRYNTPMNIYSEKFVIAVAVEARETRKCEALVACLEPYCGIGGMRLAAVREGLTSLRRALMVHLSVRARNDSECQRAIQWEHFYRNKTALQLCDFLIENYSYNSSCTGGHVAVYAPEKWKEIDRLTAAAASSEDPTYTLCLGYKRLDRDDLPRAELMGKLRAGNESFLLMDYEIWHDDVRIKQVDAPCIEDTFSILFSDNLHLYNFAPRIKFVVDKFNASRKDLRSVLEYEASLKNVTEAACSWALNNIKTFNSWLPPSTDDFFIKVLICDNSSNKSIASKLMEDVIRTVMGTRVSTELYTLIATPMYLDCRKTELKLDSLNSKQWLKTVGIVTAGDAVQIALSVKDRTPIAIYQLDESHPPSNNPFLAMGDIKHLAVALSDYLHCAKWLRIAIISDNTPTARRLTELIAAYGFIYQEQIIQAGNATEALTHFKKAGAKIFLVNTNGDIAEEVLCASVKAGMSMEKGYAWVARMWPGREPACGEAAHLVTVSLQWRGPGERASWMPVDGEGSPSVRSALSNLLKQPHAWPEWVNPLGDALLTITTGFDIFIQRHFELTYNLHTARTTRMFMETLENITVRGVTQDLRYTSDSHRTRLISPLIFIDKWVGQKRCQLSEGRIRGGQVINKHPPWDMLFGDFVIDDGTSFCMTTQSGDEFTPTCHDTAWGVLCTFVLLTAIALVFARRARLSAVRRREAQLSERLVARRKHVYAGLAGHMMPRAALTIGEEIGVGNFGRVRRAILRVPNKSTVAVAVKFLADEADEVQEEEFLREATILASLEHQHVVRLIGVCAEEGPPLLLMEYAFFGSLLSYLRTRRHLVEQVRSGGDTKEEATHVSAAALTRLAREAASALGYLAHRRIVHRDVRADNCLVDAHRSLKLADFGMARDLSAVEEQYVCRRRAMFPVIWMAPESLERGVFSTASDVWSFGVLLVEMVTLGERPYGSWSPQRVLQYVEDGGTPPFPPDATNQMRSLAQSCWQHVPARRPTAAEIVAYLAEHPTALVPALKTPVSLPETECDSRYSDALH